MLDYVNKVRAFANQFVCLDVFVRVENIVITLLKSLSEWYEYLFTIIETISMKKYRMDYVMA